MQTTKTVKVSFSGWEGNKLDGRLELPSGGPAKIKAYTIICNCFTCTKDTLTTFRVSKELAQHGYATLRFDFSGLGDSEGVFSKSSFTSNVYEVLAASNFLRENYRAPSLLLGHSLGGTAALKAAMQINEAMANVRAISTIASPSQPDHILHHFGNALTLLDQGFPASIEVAGQHYGIEPPFIEDLKTHNMEEKLASLDKPVLIFNISDDELVGESNAEELNKWVKGESEIITVENSNHLLSN
jgi:putative redox protein